MKFGEILSLVAKQFISINPLAKEDQMLEVKQTDTEWRKNIGLYLLYRHLHDYFEAHEITQPYFLLNDK